MKLSKEFNQNLKTQDILMNCKYIEYIIDNTLRRKKREQKSKIPLTI